jgi:AraC family transcriptional regulator
VERALAFVREHIAEPLRADQVAKIAGFAPDYFSRLFQREHGASFRKYLLRARIDRAREMLAETPLSIDRIQSLAGFRTRTHFYAAFKRAAGKTPGEYRAHPDAAPRRRRAR